MIVAHIGFLFNSLIFIFAFLPLSLILYHLSFPSYKWNLRILLAISFIFYAFWDIHSLPILLVSIYFNFRVGKILIRNAKKELLTFGVFINLVFLVSTKYSNLLLLPIINCFTGLTHLEIINSHWFPVGVSFFTFTQIGYLVDCYRSKFKPSNFTEYANFVTFFPHMIAGPILNYKKFVPQFSREFAKDSKQKLVSNIALGIETFVIGMAKKVLIADKLGQYVNPLFSTPNPESALKNLSAYYLLLGIMSYSLQLYFDFSGYSEMAYGIAKMFGLTIPVNFTKPYLASSVIDFWRRWHISLSEFLRNYLYVPLGGNRGGGLTRYRNLLITMSLGGLWHGANWTFAIWGLIQGIALSGNHILRSRWVRKSTSNRYQNLKKAFFTSLTFIFVSLAWVLFRSPSISFAMNFYKNLYPHSAPEFHVDHLWLGLLLLGVGVLFLERTIEEKETNSWTFRRYLKIGLIFSFLIFLLNQPSSYLYAQF